MSKDNVIESNKATFAAETLQKVIEREAKEAINQSKCFEVVLSTKDRIKCDPDELWRVVEAIKTGMPAKLKQGFFNPSHYVAIVLDEKRYNDYTSNVNDVIRSNSQAVKYDNGAGMQRIGKMKPLRDIFEGLSLNRLPESGNVKKLNDKEH